MPNSRYEAATTGWLNLLQDTAPSSKHHQALMVQLKQEVLHNLLERPDLTALDCEGPRPAGCGAQVMNQL